ncbi:Histidinol-phosphatase [hydrothermal vent metagenome]|uniref:D,D-heptose 1,7-bisphosphate phosphatase n=1 Tax=hydrothermal vent metagenome TaxID=652676 RepID=A0A3B1A7Z8_9ZZZZ
MKLIILDRDGVINEDSDDYIKSPEEFIAIPNSFEAITRLCHADYKVVIATNQSGLARGYYDLDTLNSIHAKMHRLLEMHGGKIESIFFCPHTPDDNCLCRKPKTGMLDDIASRYNISLENVPFVGDSLTDIKAAQNAGAIPYLVKTGKGQRTIKHAQANELDNIPIYNDLNDVVNYFLNHN